MEQVKQAVTIIKNRWQEVVLIFGMYVIGMLAMAYVSPEVFESYKAYQVGKISN